MIYLHDGTVVYRAESVHKALDKLLDMDDGEIKGLTKAELARRTELHPRTVAYVISELNRLRILTRRNTNQPQANRKLERVKADYLYNAIDQRLAEYRERALATTTEGGEPGSDTAYEQPSEWQSPGA